MTTTAVVTLVVAAAAAAATEVTIDVEEATKEGKVAGGALALPLDVRADIPAMIKGVPNEMIAAAAPDVTTMVAVAAVVVTVEVPVEEAYTAELAAAEGSATGMEGMTAGKSSMVSWRSWTTIRHWRGTRNPSGPPVCIE